MQQIVKRARELIDAFTEKYPNVAKTPSPPPAARVDTRAAPQQKLWQ
ncbi:hypothetical protein [Sorangium sp. So ce887]